jgi:transcriptional regulator with XRE-family HTH domain
MPDPESVDSQIATRLQGLRQQHGLSLAQLAAQSGVSKAMISRIERAESSPTAALLGRLAAALGVTLAELLAPGAHAVPERVHRLAAQPLWRDPEAGYRRRQVAPRDAAGVELVEIELPRAAEVRYPPWGSQPYRQRLWLLEGRLRVDYGSESFELDAGDSLDFGVDRALAFQALGRSGCRYLLVLVSG